MDDDLLSKVPDRWLEWFVDTFFWFSVLFVLALGVVIADKLVDWSWLVYEQLRG